MSDESLAADICQILSGLEHPTLVVQTAAYERTEVGVCIDVTFTTKDSDRVREVAYVIDVDHAQRSPEDLAVLIIEGEMLEVLSDEVFGGPARMRRDGLVSVGDALALIAAWGRDRAWLGAKGSGCWRAAKPSRAPTTSLTWRRMPSPANPETHRWSGLPSSSGPVTPKCSQSSWSWRRVTTRRLGFALWPSTSASPSGETSRPA